MKIAICVSEAVPFAKTGGLADVAGALPLALERLGHEVAVIMPLYRAVRNSGAGIRRVKDWAWSTLIGKNVKVFFIENDPYFNREGLYGDKAGDYPDNLDRFSYYCKEAVGLLKDVGFKPDIIHLHDWQASLVAVYLRSIYAKDPFYKKTKIVLTVHNIGYQGLFPKEDFPKLGLDWNLFDIGGLEFYGQINLLKGGLEFCDAVNTVSDTYAKEIQTKEFGFGLEGAVSERRGKLSGILNGLDYSIWDPKTDKFINKNYDLSTIKDKAVNKEGLQKSCGLPVDREIPLFGIVSRLARQKGFDILADGIDKICRMGVQLVILGTGEPEYHSILQAVAARFPKAVSLNLKLDDPLAHKIYAGSDIFLMPSHYEPCGLGQMISLRYGTIPLVFRTGGLADTVNKDNGFIFDNYSSAELIKTITKAAGAFKDKPRWEGLVASAMKCDFSWESSARRYVNLYEKAKAS